MGTLGDRIGRRRLLLIGAAAFGVASIAAAFSTSARMLIATRALLGVAGATIAPSTLSLIRNMFLDPRQRTTAIGVWITSFSVGGAIGPLVGGIVLEYFWWGAVFLIGVPVMVLLLIVGPRLLPEYRDPERRAARSAQRVAVAAGRARGDLRAQADRPGRPGGRPRAVHRSPAWRSARLFVRRQLRLPDPLMDLRLFRMPALQRVAGDVRPVDPVFVRRFSLPAAIPAAGARAVAVPRGAVDLPWDLGFVAGSMLAPVLVRRIRPAFVMAGGLALAAIGFAMFTRIDSSTGFAMFAVGSTMFSLGLAPVFTLTTDLVVGSAPPERAGAASAISETSAEFGGALGIAIFGSIGVAVYRAMLGDALPTGVPVQAADAARATLGGAVVAAGQLAPPLGAELTRAAQTAFIAGLRFCAAISAIGSLALGVFAGVALRGTRPAAAGRAVAVRCG